MSNKIISVGAQIEFSIW